VFVSFEGPEGAGKSTLIALVAAGLSSDGHRVVATREPGDGPVGKEIRQVLLHGQALDPKAELFLFLADRAQHVADMIRPALKRGEVVLCDRYADSTIVYQGYGRGLDIAGLREWNAFATDQLQPDLTLLLDLPVEAGLARIESKDRMDGEPTEFHNRVRQGFLKEAGLAPDRWVVIDASQAPDAVAHVALSVIRERLPGGHS
jgi:dTMP kinase